MYICQDITDIFVPKVVFTSIFDLSSYFHFITICKLSIQTKKSCRARIKVYPLTLQFINSQLVIVIVSSWIHENTYEQNVTIPHTTEKEYTFSKIVSDIIVNPFPPATIKIKTL